MIGRLRVTFLGVAVGLAALFAGCAPPPQTDGTSRVVKVYDGDTVRLANGERVRLIGIDCPESTDSHKLFRDARRLETPVEVIKARGRAATRFTRDLVQDKTVYLELDHQRRDVYDRLLAYLWIPLSDGEDLPAPLAAAELWDRGAGDDRMFISVNASIMRAGFAEPMNIPPNDRYAEWFTDLYEEARREKQGLWGDVSER